MKNALQALALKRAEKREKMARARQADPFIRLRNVSVRFPVHAKVKSGKVSSVGGHIIEDRKGKQWVAALDDISLDIESGDRVGVTGHNGAGKSTFLQVLAGTQMPTFGGIAYNGRIARLLSANAGMQAFATGYENIKLRGMLQGMSDAEIEAALPGIEEFTELGSFMHMPIAHYSGGMRLRLSFAIATAMKPDILLIDEWMGAGDRNFQKKASERFSRFTQSASILVMATHNPGLIDTFCNVVYRFEHGKIVDKERR